MIKIHTKNFKKIRTSLVTNPILIIFYWIFCYELAFVSQYGRVKTNFYILLFSLGAIIFTVIYTVIKIIKSEEYSTNKLSSIKAWRLSCIVILIVMNSFYGYKIYQSSINLDGKLSWYLYKLKTHKTVDFQHNNIFDNGVEGIFKDINKKYSLPKKLYILDDFDLKFNRDGEITSIYTVVYGKNNEGKNKNFLITYNVKKSDKISVVLSDGENTKYNNDKLLEPLIKTVKAANIKKAVKKFDVDKYGLVYYGKRDWGSNTEGIINVDSRGKESYPDMYTENIIGYTVSVFVLGKQEEITPIRYNLVEGMDWLTKQNLSKEDTEDLVNENEKFYLSKEVGFKLVAVDGALGKTLYSLNKTIDGGNTWIVLNENPFNKAVGGVSGIKFIDDKLGFLVYSDRSSNYGGILRTEDGGLTFKEINLPPHEVEISDGVKIIPFDLPSIPYEKEDVFYMQVGQGSDGDYKGNNKALYQSKDKGITWTFFKEE